MKVGGKMMKFKAKAFIILFQEIHIMGNFIMERDMVLEFTHMKLEINTMGGGTTIIKKAKVESQ